jgi:hypothetical protein
MESFDSHCKAFSFFSFDLLSADSYWHIFYAILFCIITSFCFWSLWKALILTAKRFPSLVLICYRLIPIGIFCFTPFFFIAKSITTFFSPFIQSDHPLPGMVFFCSAKQNYIVWILISIWLIGILVKCIFYVRDCISLRKILNQSTYLPNDAVLDKIMLFNSDWCRSQ